MKQVVATGLAMLAGAALGAGAVDRLHAQNKAPGAYAVIDISAITDADTFTKQPARHWAGVLEEIADATEVPEIDVDLADDEGGAA